MRVRQRRPDDLPALVEALRAVHEHDGYPVRWKADPAGWLTPEGLQGAWVAELPVSDAPAGHAALVAVDADEPAAGAWSVATEQDVERLSCLTRLFVGLGARRAGVGAALLDTVVAHTRAQGRTAVLEVNPADAPAVALYRRHGWRPAGDGPVRWWVPDGGRSLLFVAPV